VVEGIAQVGYPDHNIRPIGIIHLICVVTYLTLRTAILGAVLLTGYMGGAIATHVRAGSPLLTHVLFPAYVSVLVWGGLFLGDLRLRQVLRPPS
jgi:DoxX-like family